MSFLTRKYPFTINRNWIREAGLDSFIVFLILYLLQPFGFSNYQGNKLLIAALFGLVTFFCCIIYGWGILHRLYGKIRPWRVWHHALATLGLIVFISFSNCLLFIIFFQFHLTFSGFIVVLYWSLIIGSIITAISISLSYNNYLHKQLENLLSNTKKEQENVIITLHDTNVRGEDLTLAINDLLYIEAQKNNIDVYFIKNEKVTKGELHTSLSAVLDELKEYNNFFQCHRSFAVNLNNITSAKGNSNGYQLKLRDCHNIVPVSRTYVPKLKSFIA